MPKKFMWTNFTLGGGRVNSKKISKKIFLLLAAVILISGFFAVSYAFAVDIFTAAIDTPTVDIGQSKNIAFTVTSANAEKLKTIAVSVQDTGFSEPTSFACPSGWSQIAALPPILNGYVCDDPTDVGLSSAIVTLNGLTAPTAAGIKNFSVSAINTIEQSENKPVAITVKNLAATIVITPETANVSQTRDYTLTITNVSGDYVDDIAGINGTLGGLTVNTCSAAGWLTCTPSGNSFTLSGGTLAKNTAIAISINATAPAGQGDQTVNATIIGALGKTLAASNTDIITVQTPANLSAGIISSDIARISKNPGAYNTATISVTITNNGQATANTLIKNLIIKDNTGADISSQFTISLEISGVTQIVGAASPILSWTVMAGDGTTFENIAQAAVSVGYNDINTGVIAVTSPATQTNAAIFTVDNTAPALNITAPLLGNNVNASAIIVFTNDSDMTPLVALCSVDNANWTACTTGVTALSAISQFAGLAQGAFTLYVKDADLAGNTGTDSEAGIIKDTIAPTYSGITALPSPAKSGTLVTVNFTASEILIADPTVTIGGGTAAKDGTSVPPAYVYKRTLNGSETPGVAVVSISGSDLAGNSGINTSGSLTIDFAAPTTSDDYGEKNNVWQNADQIITLTPLDPAPSSGFAWTKYCTDDGVTPCTPASGTAYSGPVTISTLGTSYFRYASQDNAVNLQATVSKTVKIDKTNPITATITAPAASSYQRGAAVLITANAADNVGSGVQKVEFYYNVIKIGEDATPAPYSVNWDTTGLNGDYDLTAKVYDNAGNTLTSAAVTIHADNIAPTISTYTMRVMPGGAATTGNVVFSPNSDGTKDTVDIDIMFSEQVEAYIKIKNSLGTVIRDLYTSGGYVANPAVHTWDGKNGSSVTVPDGVYTVEVSGTDHAGNNAINNTRTITVDNTLPVVDAGADIITNTSVSRTGLATETGSGVASVLWSKTSGPGIVTFGTATALTTTISADTDGAYVLRLTITDNAGNIGIDEINFTRDTAPPTASITSPIADAVVKDANGNVSLIFNSNGGSACEYKVDGGSYLSLANCTSPQTITLADGRKSVVLKVTDAAGNPTESSAVSFVVDTNNNLIVGATGADFTGIQTAIDKATAGDTINVAAGTYAENVNVNKSLTLTGASSVAVAVNAANPAVSVFNVTANSVNISGFTVSGATGGEQAGIFLNAGVTGSNIHDNILTGNFDGVWLGSGSNNNTFTSNTANSNTEYGMRINSSDGNTLTANTFNLNVIAGIRLKDTITNLALDGNNFTNSPIGIDIAAGAGSVTSWTVANNKISGNTTGVSNGGTGALSAARNWWGSIEGPTIASNPHGNGNSIIGNAVYASWCANDICSPYDITAPIATLSGKPNNPTNSTSASITVGGAEVVYYKYKLDGGIFGAETAIAAPITLSSLSDGSHTISVIGRDQAGNWQAQGLATSHTWTVDTGVPNAPIITHIATDEKINNAEKGAIVVTGTAEANSLVTVNLTNSATVSGSQQLSGGVTAYSITIDGTLLTDGIITPSVTATDAATNVSPTATTPTALKDTVAPAFTIIDGVATGPVKTDTINLTVTEINPATSKHGFSVDNICNGSDTINTDFTSTTGFDITGNHTDYLCAKATDTSGNETYQLVGKLNTDNTNPDLTLGSLFTGQTLTGGRVYSINWTSSDLNFSGAPIKLEYSIDGGSNWHDIVASTENDGVYAWSVPTSINSSASKIRITAADLAGNSDSHMSGEFIIAYSESVDTTPPVVTLNSPNGAESYQGGSTHVITWTATDNVTPAGSIAIKLEYSTDGSAHWHSITDSTENDGAYLWTATTTATTNALVKVTATDAVNNSGSDLSNAVFTITAQPAHICTDAGGGNWTCDISLSAGWNLVSLPVIISNTAIANVLSGISSNLGIVKYYTPSGWLSYKPAVYDSLTTIEDGKGYWVNMTAPGSTLTVTGAKAPAAPALPKTYSVDSGWNLIGFKSTITQPASTYLQSLPVGGYTLLNASNENKTNGLMDSGKGYWLWMNAAGSIATYSETE